MQRLFIILSLLCGLQTYSYAQFLGQLAPPNDWCGKAIAIEAGERLYGHSNDAATPSIDFERPATVETTCIQTIENDVWYKFKAQPGVELYEVQILAGFCTTPAGLQALIIQSEDCSASHFAYRGCSNKINTDTIKLFVEAPEAGKNYFIWIDGYDGTICEYEIALIARKAKTPADYKFMRFDYDAMDAQPTELPELQASFANNAATINWTSDQRDGNALFIIELLPDLENVSDDSKYARVVGFVEAKSLVGQGAIPYTFTDYVSPYISGKSYRYRIVLVDENGNRAVSQTVSTKAKLVESYEVREVKASAEPGKYVVHYINRKRGQKFDVAVQNEAGEQVKHMLLDNEPIRDGNITIDMSSLPVGQYFFIMSAGKDQFRRAFMHVQ